MGQAASQTWSEQDQELWKKGQKTDLFTLMDTELQELLQIKPMISLNEIRQVGMTIQKQKQKSSSKLSSEGYYAHDADRPQTQLALRLNGMSKELLAKHRFQLVPSRLKEPVFWEATILLLQERLEQYNERCRLEQQQREGGGEQETETNNNNNNHTKQNTMGKVVSSSSSFSISDDQQRLDERVEKSLISRLALKDFEISTLKEQVQELQKQLQSNSMSTPRAFVTTTTTSKEATTANTTNTSSLSSSSAASANDHHHHHHHTGEWIMDKDSQEFLQYPEEIKTNMRKEKQRRLDQVQKEMKFILDSDNIEDTNGHWTCCGANSYRAESCQQQQQQQQ
eukprot:scaffold9523_cov103-Cylindrotheca_fusiformis.AAC.18